MSKWFVIVVLDECSVEHRDAITDFLNSTRAAWWHFSSCTWIVDAEESMTTGGVLDSVCRVAPNENVLVLEFPEPENWAGFGPPQMFEWFQKFKAAHADE